MITIIDYGLGNLASVGNALEKLGITYQVSEDVAVLKNAKALIFPGVGAAGQGMKNLKERGIDQIIIDQVKKGTPMLGICLGMQLLFERSEEGNVPCLEIFKGTVRRFQMEKNVPQIGWNNVKIRKANKVNNTLFNDVPDKSFFYFVNSFYCDPKDTSIIAGKSTYGETFASIVAKGNVVGMQFHPEKSGKEGFNLIRNFVKNYVN